MKRYLIVTPPWTHTSSGVRVLHILCDTLNKMGQKSFIVLTGHNGLSINPDLETPLWDGGKIFNPDDIVVYPEIINGNPLAAKNIVRYVLGQKENQVFESSDIVFGYTSALARNHGSDRMLTIPTFDRSIFNMEGIGERSGACFYSNKYDRLLGYKLPEFANSMMRVHGSVENVVSIYKTHETLYAFEDTEAIVNAGLCGCKIVLVKTPYFNKVENEALYFRDIVWDDGEWANPDATETSLEMVLRLEEELPFQIKRFIEYTQQGAWGAAIEKHRAINPDSAWER